MFTTQARAAHYLVYSLDDVFMDQLAPTLGRTTTLPKTELGVWPYEDVYSGWGLIWPTTL